MTRDCEDRRSRLNHDQGHDHWDHYRQERAQIDGANRFRGGMRTPPDIARGEQLARLRAQYANIAGDLAAGEFRRAHLF